MKNIKNDWDWRIYCGNKKCDFKIELKMSNLKSYFDGKFNKQIYETNKEYDINIFSDLYDEIMCGKCETFPLYVINNVHEYILNPKNIIPCEECGKPIILTRLKIKKNTKICAPCARGEEKSTIEKIKIHNDQVIPKSPLIPANMTKCEKCGEDSTTRYIVSTGNWFLGCSTFPTCWWRKNLPQIAEVKGANITFNMKGMVSELLNAAKEATKVNNKQIVDDIYVEMIYRQENRILKNKKPNRRLNEYADAVLRYKKSLEK
jgi:hypothetical protein|tara:strand:+ start:725 stop:1507 length:783 start_codon:yes stop_codon:yes gene_type:complete